MLALTIAIAVALTTLVGLGFVLMLLDGPRWPDGQRSDY